MAESMFTNPYDAQIAQQEASRARALESSKIPWYQRGAYEGQMAGEDFGRSLGGMLGMQTAEEAKQAKIEEIMSEFGDGEKSASDLLLISDKFRDAGMLDLWKETFDMSQTALTREGAVAKANIPSKSSYDEAGNLMYNQLDTPVMQENFMKIMYPDKTDDEIKELRGVKGFKSGMDARLKNATDSFSRYVESKYKDKNTLNQLLGDSKSLMNEFKSYSASRGNEYIKSLSGLLITADPAKGGKLEKKDGAKDTGGQTESPLTVDDYITEQNPDASKGGVQWRKNFMDREIGNLGVEVNPNPAMSYSATDTGNTVMSIPGVDATVGSANDLIVKSINGIVGYLGDAVNLVTGTVEGDKKRAGAESAKDWYDDGAAHIYFAEHPEQLDEAKKDPQGFYEQVMINSTLM